MSSMVGVNLIKPQILLIFKILAPVFNAASETFNAFYYIIGIIFVSFLGIFIVIFLLYFLIIFVYNILYYLISKIDWINNKRNKKFSLIENKKFIFYIIKYIFVIIFMVFFNLIMNKLILNELIPLDYIINNFYMTYYWFCFMLFFYLYIYFFVSGSRKIKISVLLIIYRFLVFFILRVILYILCPEEYTIYLTQGLVSILLYPNFILILLNKISDISCFIVDLSPGISKAEAEGIKFPDYLDEKYEKDNPKRNPINYPRLMDIPGMPPLHGRTNLTIENIFYLPPTENVLVEEFTIYSVRSRRNKLALHLTELKEVNFMCSGTDEPTVSMPVFIKYLGIDTNNLPYNSIPINFADNRTEIYIYTGQKEVINYIVSEEVFTIRNCGTRENYCPLFLKHIGKKIFVNNLIGEGVILGNSRGRIYTKENAIAIYQHALLRQKYNIKCMTD